MTQLEFAKELYTLAQSKLNRGDNHVSNIAINKIVSTYVSIGYKLPNEIIENFATIKPAKSVEKLCEHITLDMKQGTRTDGVEKNFNGLVF